MSVVINFPSPFKHYVLSNMNKTSDTEIKEFVCIVLYQNGDSEVLDTDASFEFKCMASKLLDFEVAQEIIHNGE